MKSSDRWAVALCAKHHREQHAAGNELFWWASYGKDPFGIAFACTGGWRTAMNRYSIWGREYGADHDVELAQVNSNPQPVLDGLAAKSLQISLSMFRCGREDQGS